MLIQFGAIVTQGSGKLGGHVFAHNRGGKYMRTNAVPINPQTTFQMEARAALSQFSQAWSGLTQEQRNGWDEGAQDFPRTDPFGNPRILSGKNLFTSLNRELELTGQPTIDDVPVKSEISTPTAITALTIDDTPALTATVNGTAAGDQIVVTATAPVSPGTSFVKNRMRVVAVVTATADTTAIDVAADYVARFGNIAQGQKIFIGAYAVNAIGQRTAAVKASAVATAGV